MNDYFKSFEVVMYDAIVEANMADNWHRANCIAVALYRLENENNQ